MTALDAYARLETTGLWRPTPQDQRREVGVSFGNATLVLTDAAGRPAAHWSLPAVRRINPDNTPALYSPDLDGIETVEIQDEMMVEALETIRAGLTRGRPRRGALRQIIWVAILATLVALCLFWLPGALIRQASSIVPATKQSEIGATLLGHMQTITGPTCREPLGAAALEALRAGVLGPESDSQVVIVNAGLAAPVALPGRIIVLPMDVIRESDDPTVVAGHLLAADISRLHTDPLERTLSNAGLRATFRLLTTGDIPNTALSGYAATAASQPARLADARTLGLGFQSAGIPITPWARSLDPTGETIDDLLAVEWENAAEAPIPLTDGEWISLKGICQ